LEEWGYGTDIKRDGWGLRVGSDIDEVLHAGQPLVEFLEKKSRIRTLQRDLRWFLEEVLLPLKDKLDSEKVPDGEGNHSPNYNINNFISDLCNLYSDLRNELKLFLKNEEVVIKQRSFVLSVYNKVDYLKTIKDEALKKKIETILNKDTSGDDKKVLVTSSNIYSESDIYEDFK